jgi:IS5 family transposase
MADRISLMNFLSFPDPVPDSRTIWLFREHMGRTEKGQLDAIGLQVKHGTIQDATFIEAHPGSSKKPHGVDAKTRRSKD